MYPVNYGIIQGFLALRKAITTHSKKYDIFWLVFDIATQLKTGHSLFAPLGKIDESPCSIQGRLPEFFRIIATKTLKNPYHLQTVTFKFLEGEENQNTERKTKSCVFSGFGNGISRGSEQKSTTCRFAAGRFWPYTWKIPSVGKDKVNNCEFFVLKIASIVCFCSVSTSFFILKLSANAFYDFHLGMVNPFISIP